jgi:hypothetical protein
LGFQSPPPLFFLFVLFVLFVSGFDFHPPPPLEPLVDSGFRFFHPPELPDPDRGRGFDFHPPPRRGVSYRADD